MNKKIIQKKRMMGYFIDAANQIIEKEGIEAVTIRKVADIAGYNSATLYNYFNDLNHLLFFASMKYLKNYAFSLKYYIKDSMNAFDKFFAVWKCFCHHSFKNPKIYYIIFFDKYRKFINDTIKEYYSIFPEELGEQSIEILPMLMEKNIYIRTMTILKACVAEGFFKKEHLDQINEMILLIYEGMLLRILNKQVNFTNEYAADTTIRYMKQAIKSYIIL